MVDCSHNKKAYFSHSFYRANALNAGKIAAIKNLCALLPKEHSHESCRFRSCREQ
ncbi:hypothetical protein GCM10009410_23430 [Shewanella ulleungensis]|uniref:Uncharacterized protein n=1 Tax=Shewanella ulleungensis TaxID=2282699 RepID=A0ABQ2QMR1_9GAMM|nr:hypothetical protein GCM10009410_23430 [Shewanella ulleungensis]